MVLDHWLGPFACRLPSTRVIDLLQAAYLLLSDWASGLAPQAFDQQLVQRAFGHRERVCASVCQSLALRRDRRVSAAAGGGRPLRLLQPRFRHGAADIRPVAAVRGDGQCGAVVSRSAHAGGAPL